MGKILDALKKAEKEATIQKKEAGQRGDGEKPAAQPELPPAPPKQADQRPEHQAPVQRPAELKDKPFERPPQDETAGAQQEQKRPPQTPPQQVESPPKQQVSVQKQERVKDKPVEKPQQEQAEVVQPEIRKPRPRPTPPPRKKDYIVAARAALEKEPPQPESRGKKFSFFKPAEKSPFTLYYPHSLVAEQFRMLRSRLSRMAAENHIKTLLITSTLAGEGKSMVASNLAITIARSLDDKVLLVDADFRKPIQHQLFNLDPKEGLSDFLLNEQPLENFIQQTSVPNLSFISSGTELSNPAELIASEGIKYFLEEVRYQFSDYYVIFDSTPVLQTSESILLAEQVDGVIFVVEAGKTDRPLVNNAIEILGKKKILGVVFNNSTLPVRSYYGYYPTSTK